MCRAPGARHCRSSARGCAAPQARRPQPRPRPIAAAPVAAAPAAARAGGPDERAVAAALRHLKAASGSHSPSVGEIERALPGAVRVDACFLSNPYATDVLMERMRRLAPATLERMVCHYPSQNPGIGALLAPYAGVTPAELFVANGACEAIQALLVSTPGPVLLSIPTFSAYYELARGPVVVNRLDARDAFRLDLDALAAQVERYEPATVVILTPNNPDGGPVDEAALVRFVERVQGRVEQVIVDESFSHFAGEARPTSLASLVSELPHLVVVNSMSKSHGIAGLRLGYAVMRPARAKALRDASLWNMNAFAEWFCELLTDDAYVAAYEGARRRYVRETRALFDGLDTLPGVTRHSSAANFALLELDRPAAPIVAAALTRHGVYLRDCADKWGLDSERFVRVASRGRADNERIVAALRDVLAGAPPAEGPALAQAA
jgi:histidinol-phosphate/aromatic aminotransferase/cobyric acid decarboxylase-like protein